VRPPHGKCALSPPASPTARSLPANSRPFFFPQVRAPQTEAGDATRYVLTRLLCPLSTALANQVWDLRSVTVQVAAAVIATLARALGLAYADAAADRRLPALLRGAGATVAVVASAVVSAATVQLEAGGAEVPPSAVAALAVGLANRRGTLLAMRQDAAPAPAWRPSTSGIRFHIRTYPLAARVHFDCSSDPSSLHSHSASDRSQGQLQYTEALKKLWPGMRLTWLCLMTGLVGDVPRFLNESSNKPRRIGCSLEQPVPTLLGHVEENNNY